MGSINFQRHRSNDITSGILHLFGAALAVAVLAVLVVTGARYGGPWHVVGYSLYGVGLIILYIASAAYHLIPGSYARAKRVAQRLDHASIYILIAATYTPVTFLIFSGVWRWSLFGAVWGLALAGTAAKLSLRRMPSWIGVTLYLVMGWMIIVAFFPLVQRIEAAALWLLVAGGLSYTVGVVFFVLEYVAPPRKYFWMHEIFHVCILGGSALHSIVMFLIA